MDIFYNLSNYQLFDNEFLDFYQNLKLINLRIFHFFYLNFNNSPFTKSINSAIYSLEKSNLIPAAS